jgi:hypothetical protein
MVVVIPVLKIVSITDDTLTEKANLRMGSKKANLNYSVVDVKWNPDPGACGGGDDVWW